MADDIEQLEEQEEQQQEEQPTAVNQNEEDGILKVADIVDLAGEVRYKVVLSKQEHEDSTDTYAVEVFNLFDFNDQQLVYSQTGIDYLADAEMIYRKKISEFMFLFKADVTHAKDIDTYVEKIEYAIQQCCGTCRFAKDEEGCLPTGCRKHKLICYNDKIFDDDNADPNETNVSVPQDYEQNQQHYQELENQCPISDNHIRIAIDKKKRKLHIDQSYAQLLEKLKMHPEVSPFGKCKLYSERKLAKIEEVFFPLPPCRN